MPKLKPAKSGVAIRMYRIGHGDCFLLAFPRKGGGDPVYVLIDCGYKPGSQGADYIGNETDDIIDSIEEATGGTLDLVIVTHEHQDHVNAVWRKNSPYFERFTIRKAWFAWTENPEDPLANELREKHKDTLLQLAAAGRKLAMAAGPNDASVKRVANFLSLEFGENVDLTTNALLGAASDPEKSINKQGLRLITQKAKEHDDVEYLNPGDLETVPQTDVKAFVLGPPRSANLLKDEGDGGFHIGGAGLSFGAAATADIGKTPMPFSRKYAIRTQDALADSESFFAKRYGAKGHGANLIDKAEAVDAADWRRIDKEWLFSAESLALKLNTGINNTSLVLAFELPKSKKILLFVGDAQRGNWISWGKLKWTIGEKTIATKDLLARTVLYKVGHHGSHNATMEESVCATANLSLMGAGKAAGEFAAMITAVNKWAEGENDPPWRHPLPAIKRALLKKCQGRVFQTDEASGPKKPSAASDADWSAFAKRVKTNKLFFDYLVEDKGA